MPAITMPATAGWNNVWLMMMKIFSAPEEVFSDSCTGNIALPMRPM